MSDLVRDRAATQLESALGTPVDLSTLADDTPLNELGLDSLLIISALVGLAEDSGVDLADYSDSLAAPHTVGDLVAVAARFQLSGTVILTQIAPQVGDLGTLLLRLDSNQ